MSTLEPTTDNLIVQRGSDLYTTTIEDMSTIQDDDLVMIGRGSESYKINGKEFKEQAGGGGASAPEIFGVSLTGSGPGFDNETYTTTVNYNPGEPLSTLGLKGKVSGTLSIAGNTSNIVGIADGTNYTDTSTFTPVGIDSQYKAFDGDLSTYWVLDLNPIVAEEYGTITFNPPINVASQVEIYINASWNITSTTYSQQYAYNGGPYQQIGTTSDSNADGSVYRWVTVSTGAGVMTSLTCGRVTGNLAWGSTFATAIRVDGNILVDGEGSIFTLASDANLDNGAFVAGDTVKQDNSPIVPTSSTITNVGSGASYAATSDMENAANAFNGDDTSTPAGCKGGSFYNTITTTPFTASEIQIKSNAVSGVTDIKVNGGNGYTPSWDGSDPGWFTVTLPQETVVNSLTMAWNQGSSSSIAFSVYGVKADGVLLADTSTVLTLTNSDGLDEFQVGDVVTAGSTTGPWTETFRQVLYSSEVTPWSDGTATTVSSGDDDISAEAGTQVLMLDRNMLGDGDELTFTRTSGTNDFYIRGSETAEADMAWSPATYPTNFTVTRTTSTGIYIPPEQRYIKMMSTGSADSLLYKVEGTAIGAVASITAISPSTPSLSTDGGTWNVGEVVTGPTKDVTATFVSADPLVPSMTVSDVVGPWSVGNYVVNTVVNPITIKPETSAITAVTESGTPAVADYAFFDPSYTVQGTVADREVVLIPGEYPSVNTANKINYNNSGNVTDPGAATINVFDFTALGLINDNSGLTVAFDCVYQGGNDWSITPTTIKFSDGSTVTGTLTQGGAVGSDSQYLARMTFTLPNDVTTFAFGTSWSQASSGGTGGLGSYIGNLKFGLQEIDFEESTLQTILSLTDDTDLNQFATGDNVYAAGVAPASFAPVTYTGNGGTQDITTGFAPDFVWIKDRTDTYGHQLFDTVRGATFGLVSNTTAAQLSYPGVTAFEANGFTIGNDANVNNNNDEYVAWCWSAGDTTVINNDGTIQSQVRSNGDFSVVSYAGNTTAGATFGHGLTSQPQMVIFKRYDSGGSTSSWLVQHVGIGLGSGRMFLNTTDVNSTGASTAYWNDTAPDSSVVTLGSNIDVNSGSVIAYCWAESPTQSFGSYTGTGNVGDISVNCGFKPAFVMIKAATRDGDWQIVDTAREPGNTQGPVLNPNTNGAETNYNIVELTDTGFTVIYTGGIANEAGQTYIYAAFAGGGGPSGVVGDITGLDMTLSESTGTWEVGQTVTMDAKPAQVSTAYLEFDSGTGVVETLSTVDPGFKPSPPGNILRFTTPNTGQTWDEELPVGTAIETQVKATNELGSSTSEWTAPVVPRALTLDMTEAETTLAYTEAALLLATFNNRHMVYCGQQAEAERDNLIANLAAQGYELTKILTYL